MSANSYGVITEGSYDAAVYSSIVRRLAPNATHIRALECKGKDDLMKRFSGLLRTFEYDVDNGPVDMAVVICDADGKNPHEVESAMKSSIHGLHYPFRLDVRVHAVRNAMDAWLLADVNAIDSACRARGGRRVTTSPRNLEDMLRPKEAFLNLLSDHKVSYTRQLCKEIAQALDLNVLSQKCPRFQGFAELVDC